MPKWIQVAETADCPPGSARELLVEGRIVALYNVDGQFYALDGVCPHQGGPLGKGCLAGRVVTCPWHGWQFDVGSGQHQFSPSVVQPGFAVRVEGQEIWLEVDSDDGSDAP
jgi:nitrite reductase/ring-hydroxylating ferredoxin subunit